MKEVYQTITIHLENDKVLDIINVAVIRQYSLFVQIVKVMELKMYQLQHITVYNSEFKEYTVKKQEDFINE